MKLKEEWDYVRGVGYLACATDKKVMLDYQQAQRLAQNDQSHLLSFSFNERASRAELFYFISDTCPLAHFLGQPFSERHMSALLHQVVQMLETCTARGLLPSNVCLDAERVYVNNVDAQLRFVYFPVIGLRSENRQLLKFLTYLMSAARPKDNRAAHYSARALDYFKQQRVFSLIELKSFLELDYIDEPLRISRNIMQEPSREQDARYFRDFVAEQKRPLE
jgi:hypothetical protein